LLPGQEADEIQYPVSGRRVCIDRHLRGRTFVSGADGFDDATKRTIAFDNWMGVFRPIWR